MDPLSTSGAGPPVCPAKRRHRQLYRAQWILPTASTPGVVSRRKTAARDGGPGRFASAYFGLYVGSLRLSAIIFFHPVAGAEWHSATAWGRAQPSPSLHRRDRRCSYWPFGRFMRDGSLSCPAGDRFRHRDRPALGRLSRRRLGAWVASLLVDPNSLFGSQGAGDVRDLLS